MKTHAPALFAALLAASAWVPPAVFGQGALAPASGPAPTMKRLDEVEARTIVNAANTPASGYYAYSIAPAQFPNGGSFYLTGNLVIPSGGGISITANNVTLDLNGYTLSSTNGGGIFSGVYIGGNNVTVRNGAVTGAFSTGVGSAGGTSNARVSNLSVSGSSNAGISLSGNTGGIVQGSTVNGVGGSGIQADAVSDSTATGTAGVPITAKTVSNVSGSSTNASTTPVVVPADPKNAAGADVRIPIPGSATGTVSTYTISQPGSYYLTNNFTVASGNGIVIASSNVTLDLNGYMLTSTAASPGSGDAIYLSGSPQNVSIQNGHVRGGATVSASNTLTAGPGFVDGLNWPGGSSPVNVRVSGLSVAGIIGFALDAGTDSSSTVSNCTVRVAGNLGIRAGSVSDSTATFVSGSPILAATISNCVTSGLNGTATSADNTNAAVQNTVGTVNTNVGNVQASVNNVQTTATTTNNAVNNLQQSLVGSRVPIPGGTSLVTISQPGSYYLTGNITVASGDGIDITASNVTLDLNGFTIRSSSANGSGSGVASTPPTSPAGPILNNITIRNGNIVGQAVDNNGGFSGGGFAQGILLGRTNNVQYAALNVSQIAGDGISQAVFSNNVVAVGCTVYIAQGRGILATICRDCVASSCGDIAINGFVVENCFGSSDLSQGIYAANSVSNSYGYGLTGIYGRTVTNCTGQTGFSSGIGIDGVTVTNSYGQAYSSSNLALRARIAIGCSVFGTTTIDYKYNMP